MVNLSQDSAYSPECHVGILTISSAIREILLRISTIGLADLIEQWGSWLLKKSSQYSQPKPQYTPNHPKYKNFYCFKHTKYYSHLVSLHTFLNKEMIQNDWDQIISNKDEEMISTKTLCQQVPVIPVLVINEIAHAEPLAATFVKSGLNVLEVTLRTPIALDVIQAMSSVPGSQVGAGTVLTANDMEAAKQAGATFAVSPGVTEDLLTATEELQLPLLPGASTATEIMMLLERGYDMLKFFPAEAAGGVAMLKSLAGPLPDVSFCPTGGVNPTNLQSYLSLSNVLCVGGSWLTPPALLEAQDWEGLSKLANEVHDLL